MKSKFFKFGMLGLALSSLGVGGFYFWQIKKSVDGLQSSVPEVLGSKKAETTEGTKGAEHTASSSGHGGGGGHGEEAKPAEGHGEAAKSEGGHGEAAKAEGGHGEEAKAEGGHGEGEKGGGRAPASKAFKSVPVFSVDEVFVNVRADKEAHLMGLKLELELFEDDKKELIKSRHSGVRDRIIEISRRFDYEQLVTLSGKLYFKEKLVSTLNEFFGQAVVKDAHISSLYLQ